MFLWRTAFPGEVPGPTKLINIVHSACTSTHTYIRPLHLSTLATLNRYRGQCVDRNTSSIALKYKPMHHNHAGRATFICPTLLICSGALHLLLLFCVCPLFHLLGGIRNERKQRHSGPEVKVRFNPNALSRTVSEREGSESILAKG